MLTHLIIRNFAIIEHLEIPFRDGFTVLSGETGAGKSIIIDALNLILGGRASTDVIRTDEDEAVVEGIFEPRAETCARIATILEAQGIEAGAQLIVRRIVSRGGRNKIFVNGSLTTAAMLAQITRGLVDISGQHEHYSLMQADEHVDILDTFASLGEARQSMKLANDELAGLRRELREIAQNVRERLHRIDFLRFQLTELDEAKLKAGEEETLTKEVDRLKNAGKIEDAVARALDLCYERDGSAAEQLAEACTALERVAPFHDALETLSTRLSEVRIQAEELAHELRAFHSDLDADPATIDRHIERLELIKRLRRKHGGEVEDIIAATEEMREELSRLENAEERGQELEKALHAAHKRAYELARTLSQARRKAATNLQARIEAELTELNMARTRFVVNFEPKDLPPAKLAAKDDGLDEPSFRLSASGLDVIEFLLAANPGETPKPLSKIASGGELSRIMLAIKSVLIERDAVDTYVFDEVDAGIGGSTADVVAHKIKGTARGHQVLCITHLAQIASRSDHHYLVEKLLTKERTQSTIRPLSEDERVEEIARMLGGARVTATTRDAARELLGDRA
ncbi:MAG: DNA repair protein RecN [Bradymonadaceae bacterium]|nr:DNA repair protein RecN [Lujinxingiaceae bacterium]